jgi:acyl-CoA synthetase (AMP-forming)/AMP-acid ligase II
MVDDVKGAPTLTEMMRRRAALSPDQQYFRLYDETVTYGRLWEQSGRYAAGLSRAGVRAGDKVCLIYPTCAEFFYTFFGALRIGAVPVPLYPTLGVDTTAAIFRDSEAIAVATIGWFRTGVDESCALAPGVRMVLEPPDLDIDAPAPPLAAAKADGRAARAARAASCSPTPTSCRPFTSWPRGPASRSTIVSSRGCRCTTTWD